MIKIYKKYKITKILLNTPLSYIRSINVSISFSIIEKTNINILFHHTCRWSNTEVLREAGRPDRRVHLPGVQEHEHEVQEPREEQVLQPQGLEEQQPEEDGHQGHHHAGKNRQDDCSGDWFFLNFNYSF